MLMSYWYDHEWAIQWHFYQGRKNCTKEWGTRSVVLWMCRNVSHSHFSSTHSYPAMQDTQLQPLPSVSSEKCGLKFGPILCHWYLSLPCLSPLNIPSGVRGNSRTTQRGWSTAFVTAGVLHRTKSSSPTQPFSTWSLLHLEYTYNSGWFLRDLNEPWLDILNTVDYPEWCTSPWPLACSTKDYFSWWI